MHWLAALIKARRFTRGAEIGAATGLTTSHVLKTCHFLKQYIVVDDWRPVVLPGHPCYREGHPWSLNNMEEEFKKAAGSDGRVLIFKGLSWEQAAKVEDKSLDFVFIDASHDYDSVLKDLNAWSPKVRKGGVVAGHDINIKEGVEKAVLEKFKTYINAGIDNVWFVKV